MFNVGEILQFSENMFYRVVYVDDLKVVALGICKTATGTYETDKAIVFSNNEKDYGEDFKVQKVASIEVQPVKARPLANIITLA